jgi:hypothetical protein
MNEKDGGLPDEVLAVLRNPDVRLDDAERAAMRVLRSWLVFGVPWAVPLPTSAVLPLDQFTWLEKVPGDTPSLTASRT